MERRGEERREGKRRGREERGREENGVRKPETGDGLSGAQVSNRKHKQTDRYLLTHTHTHTHIHKHSGGYSATLQTQHTPLRELLITWERVGEREREWVREREREIEWVRERERERERENL